MSPRPFDRPNAGFANPLSDKNSSRRRFLQTATGGTVAGLLTAVGVELAAPHSVIAQSALSPGRCAPGTNEWK